MPVTDLLIWYLAIYGMAWTIVHSKLTAPLHNYINEQYIAHDKYKFLFNLINCIVCVSFWCAAVFVNTYFNSETFITKLLICFSNLAFTWFMANRFGDREEDTF
jgi:hypothetical protein